MAESAGQEVAPEQVPDKRKGYEFLACGYGEMCLLWLCNALQSLCEQKRCVYHRFIDYGKFTLNGCPTPPIQLKPRQVEDAVLKEMQKRIEQLKITKREDSKPDTETESIKTEIIRIDGEIQKLMEKLADADSVLFDYIQKRVSALHEQKSELDKKMQTMLRLSQPSLK